MDTTTKRLFTFFNISLLYLSLLCVLIFCISFTNEYVTYLRHGNEFKSICNLQLHSLKKNTLLPYSESRMRRPETRIVFNPSIDLSSRFNWNVKQIFLYLCVIYDSNTDSHTNSVKEKKEEMLWWLIINGKKKSKNINSRFVNQISFGNLPDDVTLELRGSRQPWVGKITDEVYFSKKFNLNEVNQ